ncbi:glycoside hydrolase family 76 protein [Mycena maculata]|uniref:Glycoside hydrolase family 76 protein n=1 Tax=Mycena maculata TaxID=230809 RepID=A0AAD7JU86_9AGAR|nr:glycoside hydrolase family 76 protein [Mycena maculata]
MRPTLISAVISSLWLLTISGSTSASPSPEKRQTQCAATLATALGVAQRLQSNYFNVITGEYSGGSHWTDANAIENIHNLMLATGTDQFSTLADNSYLGRTANLQADLGINLWSTIVGGSYDDASWMILALWKIADYKAARGLDNSAYLASANTIYSMVESAWDTTVCGGGVWWSSAKNYKNSITNELYLLVSATGAINFPSNTAFLENANLVYNWITNSQLRNSQGLFNDGLTSTCTNNGETTWVYNQAVIASGLGALYAVTGNEDLLTQAEVTLDATIALLTTGGILKESCDDAAGATECDNDQEAFKGIFTKHLQYYLDRANDPARVAKYSGFLGAQTSAVFHYGTDSSDDIGSVWYAPNQGGSEFSATSSSSGLAAHIAAAKYGPC